MSYESNPRSVVGDNKSPDLATGVMEALKRDYANLSKTVTTLLTESTAIPAVIETDDDMGKVAALIKKFRDFTARAEGFRTAEKEPHFRAGQAVDSFFFGLMDQCGRRDKKAKPGPSDLLQFELDDYQQKKLLAEQERRRIAAEEAARVEREARMAAEKLEQEARERRDAAERARVPERIAEKSVIASQAEAAASAATVESMMASDRAEAAYIDTLAKPADIVRQRVGSGPLVTMAQEGFAEIVDQAKLDMATLWPFISLDAKEKALRAWAKTTGHTVQMYGAAVGKRNKSKVL